TIQLPEFFIQHCIGIIGCSAVVLITVVVSFYYHKFGESKLSDGVDKWGQFGDYIGGTLNPLLSFLALIVLLRTYAMQREELKKTEETQKRQQFENMFFELLKVHNQFMENFFELREFVGKDGEKSDIIEKVIRETLSLESLGLDKLHDFFTSQGEIWGEYFRVLYQLLKFIAINSDNGIDGEFRIQDIARNDVSHSEKMYSNIVRALLPDDIMKLLSINCYIEDEDKKNYHKYKALIERYAFFEHASFNEENDSHKIFVNYPVLLKARNSYNSRAFGK
ncbi:MAG: putative phage abortive infection protein, partial [Methylococcales bacterium]|nr:putative phage abortive infection protein [Methylococcales bacterium]